MAAPLWYNVSVCVSRVKTPSDEGTDCFPEDGEHPASVGKINSSVSITSYAFE